MEVLQSPLALLLYGGAAALAVWGWARHKFALSFLGGLLWAAGTVCALVDGAGLEEVLCATLFLLLLSTARTGRRAGA